MPHLIQGHDFSEAFRRKERSGNMVEVVEHVPRQPRSRALPNLAPTIPSKQTRNSNNNKGRKFWHTWHCEGNLKSLDRVTEPSHTKTSTRLFLFSQSAGKAKSLDRTGRGDKRSKVLCFLPFSGCGELLRARASWEAAVYGLSISEVYLKVV